MTNEKLINEMTREPFFMQLTKEEYGLMQQDNDFKSKIFDIRDKLESKKELTQAQFNYLEKRKQHTEMHRKFNDLGGFVFSIYQRMDMLFDDDTLSQEDKAKLLLLATYVGYDGKLKFNNNNAVQRSHLPILLRVNNNSTKIFLKKVKDLHLLEIDKDKNVSLSDSVFFKGETKHNNQLKDDTLGYTRIFINSYQYLYENLPKSKLKYLGLLYNLFGYINFHHNVLVLDNPNERDIENVNPMTFDDLCLICGYKEDMTSQSKGVLKRSLLNIKLQNGEPLFAIATTENVSKIFINPYVTFASSNIDTWNSTLEIIFKNKK